jgi:hypothetical protein
MLVEVMCRDRFRWGMEFRISFTEESYSEFCEATPESNKWRYVSFEKYV